MFKNILVPLDGSDNAYKIDLVIISSKGHEDLTGYLLGGVSHKVTGLAKCPVMVIN